MASELQWVHQYCLTCDQQTDGATYCSESCRLADYEEATQFAPPTSGPGSPSWAPTGISTYPWTMGAPSARSRQLFSLTPNYDFAHPPQPSSSARPAALASAASTSLLSLPPTTATTTATTTTSVTYQHVLSPSSSHSSLSSMRSSASSTSGALGALSAFANGTTATSTGSQSSYSSAAANGDLSQRVRSELRKYASSLEQGRLQRQLQRRRSC
ncbi:hypothetical protein F503_02376 [Ophiostoma piceae UAMH 11346]|uniref:Life-span regulatory factor domain-containing protein n=1 Tax=Ophiostoma piceae (strain UAMH 11346) TaxID=1262450 RepID=S3CIP7_OPHP1|nr:hypothetical protein F503_02376 [Ophiostoma piceae UAMH 11346]